MSIREGSPKMTFVLGPQIYLKAPTPNPRLTNPWLVQALLFLRSSLHLPSDLHSKVN